MHDPDQESLLPESARAFNKAQNISQGIGNTKWRKNLFLFVITILLVSCLVTYFYLYLKANDSSDGGNDQSRYKPLSRRRPILDHESIFSDSGPSMIKLSDLLAHCIVALRIGGQDVVKMSLAQNDRIKDVGSKGKTLEGADDIVTGADLNSHHLIVNTIKDSYRRLKIVSEEDDTPNFGEKSYEDDILPIDRREFADMLRNEIQSINDEHVDEKSLISQDDTLVWIDPLDATKEYSENLTDYVTLMACVVHKSRPIAGVIFKPFTNQTYWSMMEVPTGKYHHSSDLNSILLHTNRGKSSEQLDKLKVIVSRSHAGDVKNVLEKANIGSLDIISAGGSGYKTIELIKGQVNAYVHLTHIKKWDICAPHAIVHSIDGGSMTDSRGGSISFGDPKDKVVKRGLVVTLSREIHKRLLDINLDEH